MQPVMHGQHCVYLWLRFPTRSPPQRSRPTTRETDNDEQLRGLKSEGTRYVEIITAVDSYIKRPGPGERGQGRNSSLRFEEHPAQFARSSLAVCVCGWVEDGASNFKVVQIFNSGFMLWLRLFPFLQQQYRKRWGREIRFTKKHPSCFKWRASSSRLLHPWALKATTSPVCTPSRKTKSIALSRLLFLFFEPQIHRCQLVWVMKRVLSVDPLVRSSRKCFLQRAESTLSFNGLFFLVASSLTDAPLY